MFEMFQSAQFDSNGTAAVAVRLLLRRYLKVLIGVAALVLVDQAILQPLLVQLNFSAPAINLAGRQRMLSQKISKEALALVLETGGDDCNRHRRELSEALRQWAEAHKALLEGDEARAIPPASAAVAAVLHEVEPAKSEILSRAMELLEASTNHHDSSAAKRILSREPEFLAGMERVVALLESSAHGRVSLLRVCGAIAMLSIIFLLACVYFAVLRPAADVIHQQFTMLSRTRDELEIRVQRRTNELRAANEALQREMAECSAVQQRMRTLSAELAHVSRINALGQLATGLAHEINQPLATVANYAGTLELLLEQHNPSQSESLSLVGQIKHAALRAGTIVRRMRNFVRRGEVQVAPVDLNVLVVEVVELCRLELISGGVELAFELAPTPAIVSADGVQILQVLVNLVQNSVQAMQSLPSGHRLLSIKSTIAQNDITIAVADSGPGLPAEIVVGDLSPFRSGRPNGLGLGLVISRAIIEQHQGHISSTNREQGGAVVSFTLPRLDQHDFPAQRQSHCACG
jgi:two-component system sensor kinase FixL